MFQINNARKSYCTLNTKHNALSDTGIMFVRQLSVHKSDHLWKEAYLVSGGFGTHFSEVPTGEKSSNMRWPRCKGSEIFFFFFLFFPACLTAGCETNLLMPESVHSEFLDAALMD